MNSPVGIFTPYTSRNHSPNYIFIADRSRQAVLSSNMLSPQLLAQQHSHPSDLHQAHLSNVVSYDIQSNNLTECLVDAMFDNASKGTAGVVRFRDDLGYWRFGHLECLSLQGAGNDKHLLCGIMSLVQQPDLILETGIQAPNRLAWIVDSELKLLNVGADCKSLGFDAQMLVEQGQMSFLNAETMAFLTSVSEEMFTSADPHTRVVRQPLQTFDGIAISATIQYTLLFSVHGDPVGILGLAEFLPSREMIDCERQLFSAVFESMSEGIFVTDKGGYILKANPAFYEVTGYKPEHILGTHCSVLWRAHYGPEFFRKICHSLNCNKSWREEFNFLRANGKSVPGILSFSHTQNSKNEVRHYVGMLMDIAEQKKNEQRIHRLAHFDSLTGVGNRQCFNEKLHQAVSGKDQLQRGVAVLFLDLDRFKPVNDSLGHRAGDQLLKSVSNRLMVCLRDGDVVSRMGGDEFAILLQGLDFDLIEQSAIKMAKRIQAQFVAPFLIEQREVFTSASIGIALYPYHGETGEALLRSADIALYAAKRAGKNTYQFYDEGMNKRALDSLIMENALRKALINESLELYFQPQYNVNTGVMMGVEALLRWNHPVFGSVKPVEFIDLAEQTDLIIPLGDWVFQQACEKLARWKKSGLTIQRVGINVSAHQFKRSDFADWVLQQIQRYSIDPRCLELEITESALMEDVERSMKVLTLLKESNIRIAIDDFGTGYSSLNYLRKFPLDTLKIDRVFIEDIVQNNSTKLLTETVIAMGKSLNLTVIAEGVETFEQHKILRDIGCDEVQGYYLSHALAEKVLINLIRE